VDETSKMQTEKNLDINNLRSESERIIAGTAFRLLEFQVR